MRILVLGAGGFIGRHIVARLLAEGYEVTGTARSVRGLAEAFPAARFVALDLATATRAEVWTDLLEGVDAIVNTAGVLRGRGMEAVHVAMPHALYAAGAKAGVKRAVLLSAISARPEVATDYAQSKLEGERVLRESGLAWTVLRPSLIYGEGSYGGTSLLRALAALPLAVPVPAGGDYPFSPLHVADLAEGVVRVLDDPGMSGRDLEPCGPQRLSLREMLAQYRAWLGFGKARFVAVPAAAMRLLGRLGDWFGAGPVSSNSLAQLIAGNDGDGAAWATATGTSPRRLDEALRDRPAQVQDRWHARLFFIAPVVRWMLALLWFGSALSGWLHGGDVARLVGEALGIPPDWVSPVQFGTSLLDVGVGLLVLLDRRGRLATMVQLAVVLGYSAVLTLALPGLWLEPLGALLKNLPVLALILVHGAIADNR